MEMVPASKMRKTQERMVSSRSYAETIRKVIDHLTLGNLEYKHPYLDERDVKRVGYLVVATDLGLAGGLNINLFKKKLLVDMKEWNGKSVETELALIGSKVVSFFNSIGSKVVAQVTGMGDNPTLSELIGPVKVMLQAYDKGLPGQALYCQQQICQYHLPATADFTDPTFSGSARSGFKEKSLGLSV